MTAPIFVFGSNLFGKHGKGAALEAVRRHGAIYGQGVGLQGNSYAIPTKDGFLRVLSLEVIETYVEDFRRFVLSSDLQFYVTPIGTGLAGYKHEQIAPMFKGLPRCMFVDDWLPYL